MESIYGNYKGVLEGVSSKITEIIIENSNENYEKNQIKLFEHISSRIKSEESMREKCIRKGVAETTESAISLMRDAIGIRVVSSFVDDVFKNVELLKSIENVEIAKEKDYIKHAKPNGYRSYHVILHVLPDFIYEDEEGKSVRLGDVMTEYDGVYAEIQLRTIAMDSWAALEHQMKYKKDIAAHELIESELKRVADELASCDLSMQTIRELIKSAK